MNAREERKIVLTISPEELRRIADKMERKYKELLAGDSTFVDLIHIGPSFTVDIYLDQEYFIKKAEKEERWIPERGSGHDGFRCKICGEWLYADDPKVCECDS